MGRYRLRGRLGPEGRWSDMPNQVILEHCVDAIRGGFTGILMMIVVLMRLLKSLSDGASQGRAELYLVSGSGLPG